MSYLPFHKPTSGSLPNYPNEQERGKVRHSRQSGISTLMYSCVLALGVSACSDSGVVVNNPDENNTTTLSTQEDASTRSDIVTTAANAGTFNTLAAALTITGLDTVLSDTSRDFTVFAPNDEAFAKLGDDTIAALLADTETLKDILLYHVIADASVDGATATSLAGTTVDVANGDQIAITVDSGKLFINMSEVIAADVMASNGIIHVIDTVLLPPADTPAEPEQMPLNLVETAQAAGNFSVLLAALEATGLNTVLADSDSEYTVFAPTDDAFNALGQDTINALLADTDKLTDILLYHVLAGQRVDATTAISLAGQSVETANADTIALSLRDNSLFINDSKVIATDVQASNGVIHVIDAVLLPPVEQEQPTGTILEVAEQAGFSTLVAAAKAANLDGALNHPGDFYTVFAPTDDAFAALGQNTIDSLLADPETLRNILLYHVLPGNVIDAAAVAQILGVSIQTGNGSDIVIEERNGELFVNDSKIIITDVQAVNGIIHVIDTVLLPPATTPEESTPPTGTILEVAEQAGFSTLVAAAKAAHLDGALNHPGDFYTVFAPTDEAFAALGQDTIDSLLADPDTLRSILLYHVLPGNVIDSAGVAQVLGFALQTGNGANVVIEERAGELFINKARIIVTDVEAVNGIIHVIDTVLLPPAN